MIVDCILRKIQLYSKKYSSFGRVCVFCTRFVLSFMIYGTKIYKNIECVTYMFRRHILSLHVNFLLP